jgi:predicted lipoprotein with Yx(FWY)xxD motif
MKRITISLLMLLAVVLTACTPATPSPVPTTEPDDTATPVVLETATAMETATTEATTESPTAAVTDATTAGSLTVSTSTDAGVSQPFLVDNEGRALYVYTQDTQNSGASACTGDCIANWPAVVVTGTPVAGEGVDNAMLGTITRDDGTTQVTYNGWPLYYYAGDAAPGDITGQGMNDVWYLVSGTGTAIQ